jgi:hypothetical protein
MSAAGEALEDVLIDRAAWTHARLSAGRQHGVELREETITQDLLLDISIALPGLSVQTYTTRQEAANGADWQWEWWFEGRQWFGLRVQAKRLQRLGSDQLGTTSDMRQAFDPDWVAAYRITSDDLSCPGRDETGWVIDVPDEDVAAVSEWCSPFPGRHGFHPSAFRDAFP